MIREPASAAEHADRSGTLAEGLDAASREARRLADGLATLDRALGEACAAGRLGTAALQAADLLRQEAEGLAQFLAALTAQTGGSPGCEAAAAELRLEAQANRLGGRAARDDATLVELWGSAAT